VAGRENTPTIGRLQLKMTDKTQLFSIELEYYDRVNELTHSGILTHLPIRDCMGILGIDGKEYPLPTLEQVVELFNRNKPLVEIKVKQGFNQLELTPIAISTTFLITQLTSAILKHAAEENIFETKRTPLDTLIPVRVNSQKQVWIWETLKQALETDQLVYFPQEFSTNHRGMTKLETINNKHICAIPGWSIGLIETFSIMLQPGESKTYCGRKQLETGLSPKEYLQILKSESYRGETGKTIEDFLTSFINHLETRNEVSYDVEDNNALWCLGQYLKVPYAELVPTGRWFRKVGRIRLDMHRTGNKRCTKSWGASTTVRLSL